MYEYHSVPVSESANVTEIHKKKIVEKLNVQIKRKFSQTIVFESHDGTRTHVIPVSAYVLSTCIITCTQACTTH